MDHDRRTIYTKIVRAKSFYNWIYWRGVFSIVINSGCGLRDKHKEIMAGFSIIYLLLFFPWLLPVIKSIITG